ncbi:DUF4252 domain-containing protein [Flavobacterium sp. CYK-55]|uniref:DUF4252 domain-containing protein n=1 Tax=Flavobacterium sp. CYK-55 TaxID=2835529 RepID=UPI001BCC9CCF|nr:DUF4252 domain-containing protein [Flavobacterium sp. CYK-55]MBS7787417.1 DUF4252 domain-containing protein [Flavobacterium sp. CYK-55]
MKKILAYTILGWFALLVSCNQNPSLQKYFVENAEKKDFISLDISPSILKVNTNQLTDEQKQALTSFKKVNVLAFKRNANNLKEFEAERVKIGAILKNPEYQELIKVGSGKDGASVCYVGPDDHISEFIIYANRSENGFAIVRVLGQDMNPNSILEMVSVLKNANIDMEQLKPLQSIMTP